MPSASRTAASVSSSYSASREAVGRRLSVSRTQRTKNAQSGSSCSARSVSSMPFRCTRWVARWAGLTADGSTYATPRTPATGTSRSMESSGVNPNSSWQCRASATRRPAGLGWARSQGAGSSVTGSSPTRTSYGSKEPKSRARARTRSGASHSAAPGRAVRYTVVPGSGRSASGSVRTVYEPSSRAVHSTGGAPGVRALRLTTRIRSATTKQASSPMPNWPRKSDRASCRPSARLELRPMVASRLCTSGSVSPTPVSSTRSPPSAAYSRTRAGASGSAARRAVMASTAFCSSSRR